MAKKQVVITVSEDGSVSADAKGFKGKSCLEGTKFLDKLFNILSRKSKGDMYKKEVVKNVRH